MKKRIFLGTFLIALTSGALAAIISAVCCLALRPDKTAAIVIIALVSLTAAGIASAAAAAAFAAKTVRPLEDMTSQLGKLPESPLSPAKYPELLPMSEELERLSARLARYIDRFKGEKEKVTLITDNMVEGMLLLDQNRNILSVNKSAVRFLSDDPSASQPESIASFAGKNISGLSHNPDLLEAVEKAAETGTAYGVFPSLDRQLQFYVNKASFDNEHGFMILLVDATEKIRADEIRKDFSANVSHELKTPLTTIKGFGEMLENGIITDLESVKKYGGTIYRESERLLHLINDIIRLSEIEEASPDEFISDVDLKRSAEDAAEILQFKADSHQVSVSVSSDEENFTIKAHSGYISELFLNLIDNSIKYNNPGGSVWVNVRKDKNNAVITVKDNGIGIPKEHRERIFERFYRVDKSRSKQTGGTGLGLSIVKHIAAYHHGSVNIESETGKGTCVTVILPEYRF